jgi:hypothetical protein
MTLQGSFYIISNPEFLDRNMYKIGKTMTSESALKSRYTTYFVRPIVLYFREVEGDYNLHEANLKDILQSYRVPHSSGNLSEFVKMKLTDLINEVDKYFNYAYMEEEDGEEETELDEILSEEDTFQGITIKIHGNVTKKCSKCRVEKSLKCFAVNSYGKCGRHSICKECRKKARNVVNKIDDINSETNEETEE